MRAVLLALVVLGAGLAGCLGDGEPANGTGGPTLDRAAAMAAMAAMVADGDDHDHSLPADHQVRFGVEHLDQLMLQQGESSPGFHALDVHGDVLAVQHTLAREPGITLVDISDPSALEVLGRWQDPGATWGDRSVAFSEDGQYLFVGIEPPARDSPNRGVIMLDVSDPATIEQVAFAPMARGAHTVDSLTIDGATYVFAIDYGVTILRVLDTPLGVQLVDVGRYEVPDETLLGVPTDADPDWIAAWLRLYVIGHDARAVHDAELGPLVYVAFAYQGLHVVSIAEPSAPRMLAQWVPPGAFLWYTHSVEVEVRDGQRIVAVGTEAVGDSHYERPSPIWLVDMTELTAPELLSEWSNPGGREAQSLRFSAHWLRLDAGRMALAHYHAGVWVFDISTPEKLRAPEVIAGFLPALPLDLTLDPDCCIRGQTTDVPYTYDVALVGEHVFAADWQSGLHALRIG